MGLLRAGVSRWLLTIALLLTLLTPAETALAAAEAQPAPIALFGPRVPAEGFLAGASATVMADGQGLRLRAAASISASVLATLADGTTVSVVDGRVSADGYWWQRVRAGSLTGWVAEMYLRPTAPAPALVQASGGCPAAAPQPVVQQSPAVVAPAPPPAPSLTGQIPQTGFGLVVWSGGGDAAAVATAASNGGCALKSAWVTSAEGDFVGFLYGAPEFVNQPWRDRFPREVPGGTPLIIVCAGPASVALTTSSLTVAGALPAAAPLAPAVNLVPAPWGPAPVAARALPPPTTGASAALVFDGSSGAVMYEKDAHRSIPPASLTKIVTAILTIEAGNLDSWVTVDVDSRQMPGSTVMGLRPGDCFRVRDLLYGLMLPSGNDAAIALARFEGGSEASFVARMNALLARFDLRNSHFVNPHGLSADGHVASAYDLAVLARYAMTLPDFTAVVGTSRWTAQGSRTIQLSNVNSFLGGYTGADGVKTGFTEEAGRTLVASVTRNGRRVFVVVMNAPNRDTDAKVLFDWAFANFIWG